MGMGLLEIIGIGVLCCYDKWVFFGVVDGGFFMMLYDLGDLCEDDLVVVCVVIIGWVEIGIGYWGVVFGLFMGWICFWVVRIFCRSLVFKNSLIVRVVKILVVKVVVFFDFMYYIYYLFIKWRFF